VFATEQQGGHATCDGDGIVREANMLKLQIDALQRAKDALRRSRIGELRRLAVELIDDGIALHGLVSSFYHKQLAQELIRGELDGQEVVNHIQVRHRLPAQK
jgi:hypothetical protein